MAPNKIFAFRVMSLFIDEKLNVMCVMARGGRILPSILQCNCYIDKIRSVFVCKKFSENSKKLKKKSANFLKLSNWNRSFTADSKAKSSN